MLSRFVVPSWLAISWYLVRSLLTFLFRQNQTRSRLLCLRVMDSPFHASIVIVIGIYKCIYLHK
ncbi:uncharacterized protein BT62DRAFT_471958 [Guyanagaster necrorhizus]|uniref:Uncharacterized protein n=1 Tax=Guyanagaster necrorhizus TaxID=856835 RepID=A0A9P7VKP2_9AGAR|nr:uncharacterized protein BT62DRAFT_471958 [Guyanagaster necrorhizus MCA 3950]KAG7441731.1 hypothetical protein BT62DRAFT_471958 [Guyanagaster necrorhizus MCA 3950]